MELRKRTPAFTAEIERLIEQNLMGQWVGDSEGAGIHRIIQILRNNTTGMYSIASVRTPQIATEVLGGPKSEQ